MRRIRLSDPGPIRYKDIGYGRFYHADCFDAMALIPDHSVDMILADLPYGTTQNHWDSIIPLSNLWSNYWRVLSKNGNIVLTAQCPFDKVLGASFLERLRYEFIWIKNNSTGHLNSSKAPLKKHETILIFNKGSGSIYNPIMGIGKKFYKKPEGLVGSKNNNENYGKYRSVRNSDGLIRFPNDILYFDKVHTPIHPTQKPVELFKYLITTYTDNGMLVLDNVAGSGTTAIAAENTGRRWICIEKDKEYAEAAVSRIEETTYPLHKFGPKIRNLWIEEAA